MENRQRQLVQADLRVNRPKPGDPVGASRSATLTEREDGCGMHPSGGRVLAWSCSRMGAAPLKELAAEPCFRSEVHFLWFLYLVERSIPNPAEVAFPPTPDGPIALAGAEV